MGELDLVNVFRADRINFIEVVDGVDFWVVMMYSVSW